MRTIPGFLSRFGSRMTPAPAVQVYYYIERLNITHLVTFMIDTGASGTCLHGFRARELQGHMRQNTLDPARGVGGSALYYGERVLLIFTDDNNQLLSRSLNRMDIQQILPSAVAKDRDILRLPSLLGRDILNRWEFRYNASQGNVTLLVP